MSTKQWYKNIPHQGILCKSKTDENFIFNAVQFVESDDYDVIYIIDANGDKHELDDIQPITSKDWWKFVPWQPIETAPLKAKLLMLYSDNVIRILYYHHNMLNDDIYPIKWLPLPEVNNEQR